MDSETKKLSKLNTARVKLPCAKGRVLVVDDDKNMQDLFHKMIAADLPHCRIDLAVNGYEAVEAFRQVRHCVLIMDLNMPVMDGEKAFDEIEKLCRSEAWVMPSVVFCSGFAPTAKIRNMTGEGSAHCLLMKPVDPKKLTEAVKSRL